MLFVWRAFLFLWACAAALGAEEPRQPVFEITHGVDKVGSIWQFKQSDMLIRHRGREIVMRDGDKWTTVQKFDEEVDTIQLDPYYPERRAFAWLENNELYKTEDCGKTWTRIFRVEAGPDERLADTAVHSNPDNDKYLMVTATFERGKTEDGKVYDRQWVSQDGGKTIVPLGKFEPGVYRLCHFLRQARNHDVAKDSTILCIEHHAETRSAVMYRTDDFGKNKDALYRFDDEIVSSVSLLGRYILVTTAEDAYNRHAVQHVWVSRDGEKFQKAVFPTHVRDNFFHASRTSTGNHIIFAIPVSRPSHKHSHSDKKMLFTNYISDSSGIQFRALADSLGKSYTELGRVDAIDAIGTLVTVARKANTEELVSLLSYDYGHSWQPMHLEEGQDYKTFGCSKDGKDCELAIELLNIVGDTKGRVGSAEAATSGILMGITTTHESRKTHKPKHRTLISRNYGLTWSEAFAFPVLPFAGNYGNIIVACPFSPDADGDPLEEIYFSLDQGHTWNEHHIEEKYRFFGVHSAIGDSSSTVFSFLAAGKDAEDLLVVDCIFTGVFNGEVCADKDMEPYKSKNGNCVDGSKYIMKKRKSDAKCLSADPSTLIRVDENCECTHADYECSLGFQGNSEKGCTADMNIIRHTGVCKDAPHELMPMQKIKGNNCRNDLRIDPVKIDCSNLEELPNIELNSHTFKTQFETYQYFNSEKDDSLLVLTRDNRALISHDSGKTFKMLDTLGSDAEAIMFNRYFGEMAYIFASDNLLYITEDRGYHFYAVKLPESRHLNLPLAFHAKDNQTFIYFGGKDCEKLGPKCHSTAYITTDGGKNFREMLSGALACEFVGSIYPHPANKDMIMCEVKDKKEFKKSLIISADEFRNSKEAFNSIIGFHTTGDFTAIAVAMEQNQVRSFITIDGEHFNESRFPPDFVAPEKQQSYSVLSAHEGAIFLHMSKSLVENKEYGTLVKSDSNGIDFVVLKDGVNSNTAGFVDFETPEGLDGIILINVVENLDQLQKGKAKKKNLKTAISFNDGVDWKYLSPPERDSSGKKYPCHSKNKAKCSLNLHGDTERRDIRDTYSSGSAMGYMVGVGNVGEHLLPYEQCSTFLTTDGGVTWTEVKKTPHQWEFGDRGSIIVLVPDRVKTNYITYSVDAGKSWQDFKFTDEELIIDDIVTVPYDTSMRFLLISKEHLRGKSKTFAISFAHLFKRQCQFHPGSGRHNGDFEYSSIKHPDYKCLFGREEEFLRRVKYDCFIGNASYTKEYRTSRTCPCTRQDFECDYNFIRTSDGTCKLPSGVKPEPPSAVCERNHDLVEYFQPTGYRKIPMSKCEGGLRLQNTDTPRPCPGKEKEFHEKYPSSTKASAVVFWWLFLTMILLVPLWIIYDRGIRRNGGFSRFGEIRLGDDELIEENGLDRAINKVVKVGAYGVAGAFALLLLLKSKVGARLRRFRERVSSRRGPSYSSLISDQFLDDASDLLIGHDNDANNLNAFLDEDEQQFDVDDDTEAADHTSYHDDVELDRTSG
ncbi:AaceriAFR018Cp [[Ashbya] aceris (nom. inval.)]|nr:AaceriAFR018Cp [[Ashbya] aceris (nom. inval.)]